MNVTIKPAYQELDTIRELFKEYTDMIVAEDPNYVRYLELQRFDVEMDHLEERYGGPGARLYLVKVGEQAAGCIAMKRLDENRCEMKRLYIRPAFRGRGIARRLVETLLADAREDGYEAMVLNTFPFLGHAVHLYRDLGFYEIPAYINSPIDSTIFMRKDLCLA